MYYACMAKHTHQNPYHTDCVDVTSSTQNAFVQDWLSKYQEAFDGPDSPTGAPPTVDQVLDNKAFERVIEAVQETYDYTKDENLND